MKSDWVYDRLGEVSVWERARGRGVRLLEEERSGDDQKEARNGASEKDAGMKASTMDLPPVGTPLSVTRIQGDSNDMSERFGSLTIVENLTPKAPPLAPSDQPPAPNPAPKPLPEKTSRREVGGLVETPQQLSNTFLSASRGMGPVPQLPPDPENEEEDKYVVEEQEMGLDWGEEDDEMKRLFAQAEQAREMDLDI